MVARRSPRAGGAAAGRAPGAAIVIGGAVAKGAFAAGALAHLALFLRRERTPIRALVGTSSGALNATVVAAGVRAGRPVTAAKELVRLWRDEADVGSVLDLDVWSALRLGGVSGPSRIVDLLEAACARFRTRTDRERVALALVVAPLAGVLEDPRDRDEERRTSFEAVERFEAADFRTRARRERMFRAAAASAAFPYAFKPVALGGLGPCVDGGIVNNTPIAHAIRGDPTIETVFVIVADPPDVTTSAERAADVRGLALGTRLVEMLMNERLVRDLAEAEAVNGWLETLDRLEARGELRGAARKQVIESLYKRDAASFRRLEIVEIRPSEPLEGSAFHGFFRRGLRRDYLREGWRAARAACERRRRAAAVAKPAVARRKGVAAGARRRR